MQYQGNTIFQKGVIIGFPTESFFALGAKATDVRAIQLLFRIKKREPGKPIALIAADFAQVKKFFIMTSAEERVAKRHWPGPLTILLTPKSSIQAKDLGAKKIGVRVPAHAGARRQARLAAAPITATSANISGQPPTKSAKKVKKDFPGILIVPGHCGRQRRPSTVVEIVGQKVLIHRQGPVHV